ncbi:MAG: hypothetical protein JXQ99_23515 [Hyphomicrobiaceae bacterium]
MFLRSCALISVVFALGGCDDVVAVSPAPSQCPVVQYSTALVNPIDEIQIWVGNRSGFAARPLLTITDPSRIERVKSFFKKRADGWFVAAGPNYNPASRMPTSEFTAKFMRNNRVITYIGWGYNYMETPGCGLEVARVLPAPDRPALLHAVFGSNARS